MAGGVNGWMGGLVGTLGSCGAVTVTTLGSCAGTLGSDAGVGVVGVGTGVGAGGGLAVARFRIWAIWMYAFVTLDP